MLRKLARIIRSKAVLPVLGFGILTVVFYYALIDALHRHKDNPIAIPSNRHVSSAAEAKLQLLYERSVHWSAQSRKEKTNNLLENPVYANFNISKVRRKKKVTLLVIVSSGPRRSDRRNAIRETWWKQCKPTYGVRFIIFIGCLNLVYPVKQCEVLLQVAK